MNCVEDFSAIKRELDRVRKEKAEMVAGEPVKVDDYSPAAFNDAARQFLGQNTQNTLGRLFGGSLADLYAAPDDDCA